MQLNEDLRNIHIRDLTVTEYCHKLKVISDLLDNIDKSIDEDALVMHTVNGLSEKYDNIATIIRHQRPLPSFMDTRAMLQLEESRLNRTRSQAVNKDTSSSSMVLHVKNNNQTHNNGPKPCRNFQRGYCQYADRCRFIHSQVTMDNQRRTNIPSPSVNSHVGQQQNSMGKQNHAGNSYGPIATGPNPIQYNTPAPYPYVPAPYPYPGTAGHPYPPAPHSYPPAPYPPTAPPGYYPNPPPGFSAPGPIQMQATTHTGPSGVSGSVQ